MRTTTDNTRSNLTTGDQSAEYVAHTPGPWVVNWVPYPEKLAIRRYDPAVPVLITHVNRLAGPEDRANALLIAAAPDMLRLLHSCLEDYSHPRFTDRHCMADRLRAVIARAEGR